MFSWHSCIATGSVCPPVVGVEPAHPNFVPQLSQPVCEQAEFVLLGEPHVERCKAGLSSKHHCSFPSRTSSSYLCRSWLFTACLSTGTIIQLHWDPISWVKYRCLGLASVYSEQFSLKRFSKVTAGLWGKHYQQGPLCSCHTCSDGRSGKVSVTWSCSGGQDQSNCRQIQIAVSTLCIWIWDKSTFTLRYNLLHINGTLLQTQTEDKWNLESLSSEQEMGRNTRLSDKLSLSALYQRERDWLTPYN